MLAWFWLNNLKAAMLSTASVEEVIDKHYQSQIDQLAQRKRFKEKISNLEKMNHQRYSL